MRSLSCSQIGAFTWCQKQWYLHYIKKFWSKEKSQVLSFGIAFHEGMETMMLDMIKQGTITDVMIKNAFTAATYSYTLGKNKGESPDTWNPILDKLINAMAEMLRGMDFEPFISEGFFRVPGFVGKIDCVAKVMGKITIVDWKTSGKAYTKAKVRKDPQLTAYSWIYAKAHDQMAFGVVRKDTHKASWHPTTRTPQQIEDYKVYVDRIRKLMTTQRVFVGIHRESKCKWCDLYPIHCEGEDDF